MLNNFNQNVLGKLSHLISINVDFGRYNALILVESNLDPI